MAKTIQTNNIKKKEKLEKETIGTITSEQLFNSQKPRYNSYVIGSGAFKNKKYPDRNKRKQDVRKEIDSY